MNNRNEMISLLEAMSESVEGDIVASADEYTVVDEHGWIHILDGEDVARLTTPRPVWNDLINSYQR